MRLSRFQACCDTGSVYCIACPSPKGFFLPGTPASGLGNSTQKAARGLVSRGNVLVWKLFFTCLKQAGLVKPWLPQRGRKCIFSGHLPTEYPHWGRIVPSAFSKISQMGQRSESARAAGMKWTSVSFPFKNCSWWAGDASVIRTLILFQSSK